jgi:hypothetical protein
MSQNNGSNSKKPNFMPEDWGQQLADGLNKAVKEEAEAEEKLKQEKDSKIKKDSA